jgi:hypothetical protein
MRQFEAEGRMSRLKLCKRSGKVVLERPEGGASCRSFQLTSYAEGVHALPHEKSYPRVGFLPLFSPRMTGPDHRSLLPSTALQATGKECSCS